VEDFVSAHLRLILVGIAVGSVMLFAAYTYISLINPKNSDDATAVLQAQDILHGNLLLHGWVNPPDSGYTTFIPLYVLGGLFTAHMAVLMYVLPPITYVMIVIVCGAITWTSTANKHRLLSTLLVAIVIALPSLFGRTDAGPPVQTAGDHQSTILLVLIAFYLLSIRKSFGLALLPLILAPIGDPMATWIGIPAVGLVGLLLLSRGQKRLGWRLVICAATSLIIAKLLIALIPMLGGFDSTPGDLRSRFVSLDNLSGNVRLFIESVLALFGANPFGLPVAAFDTAIVLIHLGVLIFIIWIIWEVARTASQETDPLKLLLLTALILNVIAFVFSTAPTNLASARYLPTLTIFGALLAGLCWHDVGISAKPLWLATPIVMIAFLIPFGRQMVRPIQDPQPQADFVPPDPRGVAEFLEANHLTEGYGSYWCASIFMVLSDGKVKVPPVAFGPQGLLAPLLWWSARQWYDMKNARFLIFKDESFGVNRVTAISTWGPPSETKDLDGYTILIWPRPLHLGQIPVIPH